MVTWFYFAVFVLSLVMTGSFLYRNKKTDTVFILFSILVTINCLGRYMLAASQTLEMALWANKFLYVGGCFAPLLLTFIVARLCGIKIPKVLGVILTLYSTVVMALVMTIGHCGLYYKSATLAQGDGFNYLVKDYGPLHILYPIMMILYGVILVFFVVYALRHKQSISVRAVTSTSILGFGIITLYLVERLTGSNISLLSIGYLFAILIMIRHFERLNMYDMSANIVSSVEKMKEYGYMVFDEKLRFVSANDYIREVFPEVNAWTVDREV